MPFNTVPHPDGRSIANGRLILVAHLGSGNYGQVYRALDLEATNDLVYFAVKSTTVRKGIVFHAFVSRHPNVVTYRDMWVEEDYVFMIMDYCPGGKLHKAIKEKKIFYCNNSLVKPVFIQVIDALRHGRANEVFHRDIKSENILCSKDRTQVFRADFGLATCEDYKFRGAGTLPYKSPEYLGEDFRSPTYSTRASDVWALGVLLLNMMVGRDPWVAAKISDRCFNCFLCDPDYFLKIFPITPHPPSTRFCSASSKGIALPELCTEISKIDSFLVQPSPKILQSLPPVPRQELTVQPPACDDSGSYDRWSASLGDVSS
ncbi:kinase-like protein [Guyanagaster necrorhizus]|uniref:Kinase-like protein n=1 Tax=Guyanagaster necrorhizus TaxID=856835 RepID=A0A9P8ARW2_9AGAR|nr:kinase-like protein [Guyanagaster necrorhizus MCA 3950]KAG7445326.1 kinase-like protein [Guyanagaster necrorhizus MCA 3950]